MVAKLVKNLPTMQEALVLCLGQEDPLENRRTPGCLETFPVLSGECVLRPTGAVHGEAREQGPRRGGVTLWGEHPENPYCVLCALRPQEG